MAFFSRCEDCGLYFDESEPHVCGEVQPYFGRRLAGFDAPLVIAEESAPLRTMDDWRRLRNVLAPDVPALPPGMLVTDAIVMLMEQARRPVLHVEEPPRAALPQAEPELRLWKMLTGIDYFVHRDRNVASVYCPACNLHQWDGELSSGSATEAEIRRRVEEKFTLCAEANACPHWPRFLALREQPEVVRAVRLLAKAMAGEE